MRPRSGLALAALTALAACQGVSTPPASAAAPQLPSPAPRLLGRLELVLDGGGHGAGPTIVVNGLSFRAGFVAGFDEEARRERHLAVSYGVTNAGPTPLGRVRLVAVGAGTGGSEFSRLEREDGSVLSDPALARSILAGPPMRPTLPIPTVDVGQDGFGAVEPAEAVRLEGAARAVGLLGPGEAVLDHGFALTPASGGLGVGTSGAVTLAYRFARRSPASENPVRLTARFLVVAETAGSGGR